MDESGVRVLVCRDAGMQFTRPKRDTLYVIVLLVGFVSTWFSSPEGAVIAVLGLQAIVAKVWAPLEFLKEMEVCK